MAEIVSEDVMDWARDLAALEKLFAGEPLPVPPIDTQAVVLPFTHPELRQSVMNEASKSTSDAVCSSSTNITALQIGIG